jgi:LuxR family maltose regulon positive regulatory protein
VKKSGDDDAEAPGYKYVHEIYQAAYSLSKRYKGIICVPGKSIKLSRQQKYILELLAKGYKNAEIVEMTGLSINTVRSHKGRLKSWRSTPYTTPCFARVNLS